MPDVRPRISPVLATLLRTGASLHGLPTIDAYLESVVRPMVQADIHRQMVVNPTLQPAQLDVPGVAAQLDVPGVAPQLARPSPAVPVPTTGCADVVADVVGGAE